MNTTGARVGGLQEPFLFLSLTDAAGEFEYVRYTDGMWDWHKETENAKVAVDRLRALAEGTG